MTHVAKANFSTIWNRSGLARIIVKERVRLPETRVSGTHSDVEKWVEGKSNEAFSSCFANFFSYLMIFQRMAYKMLLQNFEKSSKYMANIRQKNED